MEELALHVVRGAVVWVFVEPQPVSRHVTTPDEAQEAYTELSAAAPVLAQQPVSRTYAQVAGLFAHGRLIAVHSSEQVGLGAGGSAAARLSIDHPPPRDDIGA